MKRVHAFVGVLVLGLFLGPAAFSAFGPVVNLGNLGDEGRAMVGGGAEDEAGFSVAILPDVNGDQIADILIGAPYANGSGTVYLVYGKAGFGLSEDLDLSNLGADGVVIQGEATDDRLGYAMAALGDLNGDNLTDFIISGPGHDGAGQDRGRCYLIYGSGSFPQTLDLSTLGAGGVKIDGAADLDYIGYSLAFAGDFDGTPDPDLIIGAPLKDTGGIASGAAYVVFWDSSIPQKIDLGSLGSRGVELDGSGFVENAGFSVSGGFDFNGDGSSDVMVGVPNGNYGAKYLAGRAYVVYGRSGFTSPLDLAQAPSGGYATAFDGGSNLETAGYSVLALGDFDADGFGDAAIAAPLASNLNPNVGRTYVVFGSSNPPASLDLDLLGTGGITFEGNIMDQGKVGMTLADAGDINEDGLDDIAIGYGGAGSTINGPFAGLTYLVIGNRFYESEETLGAGALPYRETVFHGAKNGDFAGSSIAGGGDIDGDGFPDLLIGAHGFTDGAEIKKGRAHFVAGQDLGSVEWPHSPPTTGVGTQGQNMSFVPTLDGWGNFTSGSALGFKLGFRVDTAWSQLKPPLFYGLLVIGFDVFPAGVKLRNATIWPKLVQPYFIITFPVLAATGTWVQNGKIPSGVPTGARIYLQQIWENPTNKKNLAATNALCITIK